MTQTQTQVPPALQVLMSMGAQPTAPGPMGQPIPSVAMQKAQEQPQGLPEMAMAAGQAAPSVMRNMEMQKFQQMLEQAMQARQQQQAPGIAGLPAQNMQFADGGVVGYSGLDGSYVDPETVALDELRVEEARRKREAKERQERALFLEAAGAPQAAQYVAPQTVAPRATTSVPLPSPEAQAMMRQQGPRTGIAAPRAEAPGRTAPTAAPATGIATALPAAPTLDKSGIATAGDAIAKAASEREARMRGILESREKMAAAMPDLSAEGIAALEEANRARQELLGKQRGDDKFNRQMALLRGFQGDRAAYDRAVAGQQARDEAANQAQLMHQQAVLKLREAQQAKQLGQFDRAMAFEQQAAELEGKARTSALEAQKIAAQLATSEYSGLVNLREQDIRMQEGAANRANDLELERMRRATADRPGETERILAEFNRLKAQDPAKAEQYLQNVERVRGLGRPDRTVMTYDQAADNVSKFLDSTSGMMEVSAIRKRAKDAGQPEPSLSQIRDMLIQRELQSAGGRSAAAPAAAAGQPIYARNPTTNERIMSTDGGKTWKPA